METTTPFLYDPEKVGTYTWAYFSFDVYTRMAFNVSILCILFLNTLLTFSFVSKLSNGVFESRLYS